MEQDQKGFKIKDKLNFLIKPKINQKLSSYFINLTGIKQEQVDNFGLDFEKAYKKINSYMSRNNIIMCNGNDGEIFRENCILNDLIIPKWTKNVFNIRPFFTGILNIDPKQFISCDLPKLAGIKLKKESHNAIDDCISIAWSIESWFKKGLLN